MQRYGRNPTRGAVEVEIATVRPAVGIEQRREQPAPFRCGDAIGHLPGYPLAEPEVGAKCLAQVHHIAAQDVGDRSSGRNRRALDRHRDPRPGAARTANLHGPPWHRAGARPREASARPLAGTSRSCSRAPAPWAGEAAPGRQPPAQNPQEGGCRRTVVTLSSPPGRVLCFRSRCSNRTTRPASRIACASAASSAGSRR